MNKQADGVALGSLLGRTLVNALLACHDTLSWYFYFFRVNLKIDYQGPRAYKFQFRDLLWWKVRRFLDPARTLVYYLQPTKKVTPKKSFIKNHMLLCNNNPILDYFSDLGHKDKFSREIKESISRDKLYLNVRGRYFVQHVILFSVNLLFWRSWFSSFYVL